MEIAKLIEDRLGDRAELHRRHVNPALARVLQIIDYDIDYVRGEGAYLYDGVGNRYLDFLGGYGVYQAYRRAMRTEVEPDFAVTRLKDRGGLSVAAVRPDPAFDAERDRRLGTEARNVLAVPTAGSCTTRTQSESVTNFITQTLGLM